MNTDYKSAGVDIEAGYKSVALIKQHAAKTLNSACISGIGGFGGLFSIKTAKDMDDPILVSGTDGVGTKLKIAFLMDKHDTVGIDCVAMCVNDIICSGARPLFFLDYIACGKVIPERIESIVKGIAEGCIQSGAALIGGETAEMPGVYNENEYDIAGFAIGIVDKKDIINGHDIKEGDALIGLASSGLHSNGYSLVRRVITDINQMGVQLLKPTRIYAKPILELIKRFKIKGIANITGGGFYENIPRIFNKGLSGEIKKGAWPVLPIFELIQKIGNIESREMYNTFNMGIGLVICVNPGDANDVVKFLNNIGEAAYIIGCVIKGNGLTIC